MPTALAEWTTERPDVPGFYWWRASADDDAPDVVYLYNPEWGWRWFETGSEQAYSEEEQPGSLWWPVRLDPPPVG